MMGVIILWQLSPWLQLPLCVPLPNEKNREANIFVCVYVTWEKKLLASSTVDKHKYKESAKDKDNCEEEHIDAPF